MESLWIHSLKITCVWIWVSLNWWLLVCPLVQVVICKLGLTDSGRIIFEHFICKDDAKLGMMVHAYNFYPEKAEVGDCLRPTWTHYYNV